jgi:hypothetical protein
MSASGAATMAEHHEVRHHGLGDGRAGLRELAPERSEIGSITPRRRRTSVRQAVAIAVLSRR